MAQKITETVGFIIYLGVLFYMSYYLLNHSQGLAYNRLLGFTGLAMGFMQGSEMLTRVYALLTTGVMDSLKIVGMGKKLHWIGVFVVGLMLYEVCKERFQKRRNAKSDRLLYALALLGIILGLFRFNQWDATFPPKGISFLRTLPMLVTYVILTMLLYVEGQHAKDGTVMGMALMLGIISITSLIGVFFGGSVSTYNFWAILRSLAFLGILGLAFKDLRNETLLSRF